MSQSSLKIVPDHVVGTAAPLRNIGILEDLLKSSIYRAEHLPGLVTFSGPSGFGKSTAAGWIAAKYQAYYIEIRSTWTKKALLENLLKQMGIDARRTIYEMMDQAAEEMASSQRPIIMDEFDNAIDKGLVELVRDLYEQSKAPIVLIGEEKLPQKLQKWERFNGRILDFAQAQPADLGDAQTLVRYYGNGVVISDDLLGLLVKQARGSVRRIVTNVDRITHFARGEGLKEIGLDDWGDQPLHMSQAPAPRSF